MATKVKDLDKIKDRKFCMVLYPDAENYSAKKVIKYLMETYDTCYVLHDKDKWSEDGDGHKKGEKKKKHFHIVFRWTGASARYRGGIAQELSQKCKCDFPKTAIEPCGKLDGSLVYLIHYGEREKYQYPIDAVTGSGVLLRRFAELVTKSEDGKPIDEQIIDILDVIESYEGHISTAELMRIAVSRRLLDGYRKYSYAIHRVLDEHNRKFAKTT